MRKGKQIQRKTNDYFYNYSEELDISWPKRLTCLQYKRNDVNAKRFTFKGTRKVTHFYAPS